MAFRDTAPYLRECLDSIQAQSYSQWELIAVNDHSDDDSRDIVEGYAARDPRIHVYDSPGYRLTPALRKAFHEANGELINRMDSDDRMPPDKLETLVNTWNTWGQGHIVAGGTQHFVDEGTVGEGFRRYDQWLNEVARTQRHWEEVYKECVVPSHCWIAHRTDLQKIGAFTSDTYPEDYELCFRFYKAGFRVIGIDKVLHYWRDRSNRISRTWEEYRDNRYFELKIRNFLNLDYVPDRPLVVWGCGRNGKDFIKSIQQHIHELHWVCSSKNRVGKDIYGLRIAPPETIPHLINPQVLIVVAAPEEQTSIRAQLTSWGKQPVQDYWFFL